MEAEGRFILIWWFMILFITGIISYYCYTYNQIEIQRQVIPVADEVEEAVIVPELKL